MGQQLVRENIVLIASLQTSRFFHVVKRQFSGANNEVTMGPFQYEQFQNFSNKILSFKEMLPVLNGVVNNLVNTNATLQPCDETIQLYQRTYKWDYVKRIEFLWLKNWTINGQAIGVFLGTEVGFISMYCCACNHQWVLLQTDLFLWIQNTPPTTGTIDSSSTEIVTNDLKTCF